MSVVILLILSPLSPPVLGAVLSIPDIIAHLLLTPVQGGIIVPVPILEIRKLKLK
jgi:hypothetical protein